MIEIVKGSTTEVIEEMKSLKRAAAIAAKPILKKYTERDIRYGVPTDEEKQIIAVHEHRKEYFTVTKYTPAYLLGCMVDYKFLSAFLRRTKDFTYKLELGTDCLCLRYEKGYGVSRVAGVVHLYNMARHYKDLQHVPTIYLKGVTIV